MDGTANETTKEFDLGELLGGNVTSVVEKLPDLGDGALAKLRELEVAGGKRATRLTAIDQAVAGRVKPKEGEAAGNKPVDQADGEATFTKSQVDELLAQQQAAHEQAIKVAVANARKEKPVTPKATPVAKPITLSDSKDGPALVALAGQSSIVFADVDDVPIATLPKLAFGPGDYEPAGDRVKLKRDVEFPVTLPETQIASAFLLDEKGVASGKAELVMPFGVGGGRSSKLPAGTLSFAGAGAFAAAA